MCAELDDCYDAPELVDYYEGNKYKEEMQNSIETHKHKLDVQRQSFEELKKTQSYQESLKYLFSITNDFNLAITACYMWSKYYEEWHENSMVFNLLAEYVKCSTTILFLIQEGIRNPVKREARYMLEFGVKFSYVDQQANAISKANNTIDFEQRKKIFKNEVPRSSIDKIKDLNLEGLLIEDKKIFQDDVCDLFAKLSAYVHPSITQIEDMFKRYSAGEFLDFYSVSEFEKVNKLILRLYDILLVLVFHDLGLGFSGDIFIMLDNYKSWKFHKGKHTSKLSKYFDYKHERQVKS